MAFQFARLPMLLIAGPLQYVLYAQLAKMRDHHGAVGHAFFAVSRVLAIVVFPAVGMVAVAHEPIFDLLLSKKWASSGHLFMIAAPACALQAVTAIGGTVRMVLGRTDIVLRMTVEFGVIRIIALVVAVWFGLEWTAISYSCAVLLYSPRSLMLILPIVGGSSLAYLRVIGVPIGVTLGCIAVFLEIEQLGALGEGAQLVLAAMISVAGIVGSAFIQRRSLVNEMAFLQAATA